MPMIDFYRPEGAMEDGGPEHVQAARQTVADGLFEPAPARVSAPRG